MEVFFYYKHSLTYPLQGFTNTNLGYMLLLTDTIF